MLISLCPNKNSQPIRTDAFHHSILWLVARISSHCAGSGSLRLHRLRFVRRFPVFVESTFLRCADNMEGALEVHASAVSGARFGVRIARVLSARCRAGGIPGLRVLSRIIPATQFSMNCSFQRRTVGINAPVPTITAIISKTSGAVETTRACSGLLLRWFAIASSRLLCSSRAEAARSRQTAQENPVRCTNRRVDPIRFK